MLIICVHSNQLPNPRFNKKQPPSKFFSVMMHSVRPVLCVAVVCSEARNLSLAGAEEGSHHVMFTSVSSFKHTQYILITLNTPSY